MRRSLGALILGLSFGILIAAPAEAQRGEGRESARSGLWGGLGVGYGTLGCEDCDGRTSGFSGMGIIGGTLSDVVRLGGGGSSFHRKEDGAELSISSGLAIVQIFPGPGDFYLQGGAGFASARVEFDGGLDNELEDDGAAFQVGLGYTANLGERGKVAIVPFANWTFTSIAFEPEFFQLGVGFFWN